MHLNFARFTHRLIVVLLPLISGCARESSGTLSFSSIGASCVQGADPRIQNCNEFLGLVQNDSDQSSQAASLALLQLNLVATVTPPISNGVLLQASDISMNGSTALVSYNTSGATNIAGAIDVFSLVLNLPVLSSTQMFPDTKMNSVYQAGTKVYAAASNNAYGAVLKAFDLNSGVLTETVSKPLSSFAATNVASDGTDLFVTTGDAGGLHRFTVATLDSNPETTPLRALTDARGLAIADNRVWVVSGQPGAATRLSKTGTVEATHSLGGNAASQSKSTIRAGTQTVLVSLGDGGAKIVCRQDGVTMATIPRANVPGVDPSLTVTNAAAAGPGVLFLANGVAGAYVYSVTNKLFGGSPSPNCSPMNVTYLGSINFGTTLSVNNIYYNNSALFVANGLGGFKVVTLLNLAILNPYLDYQ